MTLISSPSLSRTNAFSLAPSVVWKSLAWAMTAVDFHFLPEASDRTATTEVASFEVLLPSQRNMIGVIT